MPPYCAQVNPGYVTQTGYNNNATLVQRGNADYASINRNGFNNTVSVKQH
ncbi:curlin repeat-containing protein [Burkholderia cepacia]|nr:curlin repeat-containing protein [Burkholderia cepacia]